VNTFIQIGNSDDKLPQAEWCNFIHAMRHLLYDEEWSDRLQLHGEWFSRPDSPYQNANWCVEIKDSTLRDELRDRLLMLAVRFCQDSIAWTEGEVEFITPERAAVAS
jgi:hypothetical protein